MDDGVEFDIEDAVRVPVKHDRWSVIVLAADTAAGLARQVANTLETGVILLSQHRMHKREESKFFEIVKGE